MVKLSITRQNAGGIHMSRIGKKIVIVGAQWGDEGKGKLVDLYAEKADVVVRYEGGSNAGHTLVIAGRTYKLHLLPSGIVRSGKLCLFGPGGVFDLKIGCDELAIVREHGSRLVLDRNASVVLPIHRAIDAGREAAAGKSKIGTTLKGIGPAYADFWLRRSIKLGHLTSESKLREKLLDGGYWDELVALCVHLGVGTRVDINDLKLGMDPLSLDETVAWCMRYADQLCEYLGDTRKIAHERLDKGETVLFESAQGALISTHFEGGKFCTSSSRTPGGISTSMGIYNFDEVIGVTKAYTTRVGAGPFPTELDNEVGEGIRQKGAEFGTTTGRARRCGWLDLPALRYACRVAGITKLVVTKLDVLSGLARLQTCEAYEDVDKGDTLTEDVLETAVPIYEDHEPWSEDITSVRDVNDLPSAAENYLYKIRDSIGLPIASVSVGPDREAMVDLELWS